MARTVNALGQTRTSFTCQTQVGTNGLQQSKTTITDGATGTQQTLVFRREDTGRAIRFAGVAQADGSTAQTTERNPQGQPTRQVNADGSVTFYTYNARGLEIERAQFDATFATATTTTTTRPALTKATSVTSTRWHATWNLPKEVAQPQLTTSYTYNARGDVTGYSTQATTDPTGAQKFEAIGTGPLDAMGYAYNANAQLSRIVQLQNGTETARWTLGYNEQGDVQRLTYTDTTTATETTQRIPQHDAHGRPEVIVAPDGSRTRLSYNTRGALTRLVQGEQITHFSYDARGVMTRIKTPDGSVFALIYDSDVNLTQVRHNGKAITAAYVATLSGEVKATVAEMAVAFAFALTDEVLDALWVVSTTALSTDRQQAQRERPLARQGGKTGQWWEYTDRNFQRWFHQCIKQPGDPDASRADLADAYAEWIQYGKPDGKNGCGGPPPPPPAPAENCGDACQKTANVVVVGGSAYVIYRCLRMLPSLLPPLWPTIPANAVTP